jgi:ornithine cyclodeaminase
MTLLLDETAIRSLLRWADLVPLMERTLVAFSTGGAVQPVRTMVRMERHRSILGAMPGYLAESDALGAKLVSVTPGNAAHGMPTHRATIVLIDAATGALDALLDGRLITEMRTAAVSAAAARALAIPGASRLAVFGNGVQAESHIDAFAHTFSLSQVHVVGRDPARARTFAARMASQTGLCVEASDDPERAAADAQLIVTATASPTPVLRGAWLAPGTHVSAVGACTPDTRELDGAAIARMRVFVDSRAAAAVEAGDLLLAEKDGAIGTGHVAGEIGEVFAGRNIGRPDAGAVTLFKSLGLAVEDVATAHALVGKARAAGIGRTIEL